MHCIVFIISKPEIKALTDRRKLVTKMMNMGNDLVRNRLINEKKNSYEKLRKV